MINKKMKIIIGSAQFGMNYGISNKMGQIHQDEIKKIFDLGYRNKINTLDTAKGYGNSEQIIGNYLKKQKHDVKWNVITKLNKKQEKVYYQIQDSAYKLSIKPRIVLAHSADLFMDYKFRNELFKAKNNRVVSKIGVSVYTKDEIMNVMSLAIAPDVIQLPMNILDARLYKSGVLSELHKNGVEIHIRSVFLQGLFYLNKDQLNKHFFEVLPFLNKLESIADEAGITVAELSLLWLSNLEEVDKIIIGVDKALHLKMHLNTIKKYVSPNVFENALSVNYENEKFLNPSLWS